MLDIKQARPKETYSAVYVTKDNADEFYELAYGYFDKPIKIVRHDNYTTYSYHERSLVIKHNCWYTADRNLWHWKRREHFDEYYEIVDDE